MESESHSVPPTKTPVLDGSPAHLQSPSLAHRKSTGGAVCNSTHHFPHVVQAPNPPSAAMQTGLGSQDGLALCRSPKGLLADPAASTPSSPTPTCRDHRPWPSQGGQVASYGQRRQLLASVGCGTSAAADMVAEIAGRPLVRDTTPQRPSPHRANPACAGQWRAGQDGSDGMLKQADPREVLRMHLAWSRCCVRVGLVIPMIQMGKPRQRAGRPHTSKWSSHRGSPWAQCQ